MMHYFILNRVVHQTKHLTREQCLQCISFLPALTGGSFRAASVVNPSSFSEVSLGASLLVQIPERIGGSKIPLLFKIE
jgi:hypothetical protein